MLVCTTAPRDASYIAEWGEAMRLWPAGTRFVYYGDGEAPFGPDTDTLSTRSLADLLPFSGWRRRHHDYVSPGWKWDVVKFAHKVFAAADAFADSDDTCVWCDADCIAYRPIPPGLIEGHAVKDDLAYYGRVGMPSETGLWIMRAEWRKRPFFDLWTDVYLSEKYRGLIEWTDCATFDAVRQMSDVKDHSISVDPNVQHVQAHGLLSKYLDHRKGRRKAATHSPENAAHAEWIKKQCPDTTI